MSLATASPAPAAVHFPDDSTPASTGQSQTNGEVGKHRRRNNNRRARGPRPEGTEAHPEASSGGAMPGTGAYLLQQQQSQQNRNNGRRRANPPHLDVPSTSGAQQLQNGISGETSAEPGQSLQTGAKGGRRNRNRNKPQQNGVPVVEDQGESLSRVTTAGSGGDLPGSNVRHRGPGRARGFNGQLTAGSAIVVDSSPSSQAGRNHQDSNGSQRGHRRDPSQPSSQSQSQPPNRRNPRSRKAFQGNLTTAETPGQFEEAQERAAMGLAGGMGTVEKRYHGWTGMKDDEDGLVSKLVRGLGGVSGGWLECVICFSNILPEQSIWSCSPTTSTVIPGESNTSACCYTPFHLSCIQDWSSRSLSEAKDRARDRDTRIYPEEPVLTWRCPGCQKKRTMEANRYECYCGKVKNLSAGGGVQGKQRDGGSLILPHSCGGSCSREKSYCGHPCPLQCHPGPCPPCQVPLNIPCPSHHTDLVVRCSLARGKDVPVPTCDEPCEKLLSCQSHTCSKLCHDGVCDTCTVKELANCYCGSEEREVSCGWKKDQETLCGKGDRRWDGRYGCQRVCASPYDCGNHHCEQECHPHPIETLHCPRSPDIVTHCPCGRTPLSEITEVTRKTCTDRIPTCPLQCSRPRDKCDHPCGLKCHEGECTPCQETVTVPCRCGSSNVQMICSAKQELEKRGEEVLCERVCRALRSCGRHECARTCCPLSYQAKFKGKKRDIAALGDDEAGLHTCSLPCNKLLTCGVHSCPQPDHRGPCPPCLEASYEELACDCGRTVIQPPIRCGTVIECTYPCARPPPDCGHPKVPHTCHETESCPPCPYLTTKKCACGRNEVKNVRCSQEKVTCGAICNSLLSCGYHHCAKSCHSPGECEEPCRQVCSKPKRLCKHACTSTCHAPSACPEDEPCMATIDQTCPCGHVRQRTTCGACTTNPVSREAVQLKCVSECAQRQRNARLAEALGIKPSEKLIEYPVELKTFATGNHSFVMTVEKAFNDFFMGPKQATLLPHTPAQKRQFILSLAEIYRFGTELVDADPHRSVQIRRRIDSRIPTPLLSSITGAPPAKRQLGGLGDFKKPSFASSAASTPLASPNPTRGWGTSTMSRPTTPQSALTPRLGAGNPFTRPASQSSIASSSRVATGSGIHRVHAPGAYAPPQKRDIEESAKDWDEED